MANTKVQSEQIEDGSITADKIADGAIVATELASNSVTTAKINADAVTGAKIADDAIDSEHYVDGSIDTAHIGNDQVTQAKIADDAVGADQLAASAVVTASIVDDNVTTAKIADGNISTALLADLAVTSAKLANNIDIVGTFDVTGATTLDSTLSVGGDLTIPSKIIHAGDTDTYLRFTNADDFRIVVGNSTRAAFNTSKIHFNQEGINQDFQVEGDNEENLFYLDASTDRIGIGTASPSSQMHLKTGTAQNDSHGQLKIEQTDTTTGNASTNAGLTTKNHHGTSQFMQWEDHGLRIGSRILTNSGEGNVVFTSGSDSEAFRINSSGNVGIGTTSPSAPLDVVTDSAVWTGEFTQSKTDNGDGVIVTVGSTASADYALSVRSDAGNTHVLAAKADGNVGIGEASPDAPLHITSATPIIVFDESDASQEYRIGSFGGAFALYDSTDSAYRLVVDGDGKVGIGETAPDKLLHITDATSGGYLALLKLERTHASASEVGMEFHQNGSGGSAVAATIYVGKAEDWSSGTSRSSTINFQAKADGTDATVFKMGSLGDGLRGAQAPDGLRFGSDTATANSLDDYEEGTWNPLLIAGTTNPTGGGVAAQDGAYTKIGNRVFCTFYCGRSWTNSPAGAVYIMNLPYTVADDADNHLHFHCVTYNVDTNSGGGVFGAPIRGDTTCRFYHQGDGAWGALTWGSHMTSTAYVSGIFSYFTT